MLTECKCGNPVEAKLDTETEKVMCQSCGKEIENISDFMKHSMKLQGDIVRHTANTIPSGGMQIECNLCHKPIVALLNRKDDECYCPKCNGKVAISGFSKALLRENGQYAGNKNVDTFHGEQKEETNGTGQVVQIDENGILELVKSDVEEETLSPFEKLQRFQQGRAEAEARMKKEAQLSHQIAATPVEVTIIGTADKPASVAELVEARKKLEVQIKEARVNEKANAPKRGRGRPKKNVV